MCRYAQKTLVNYMPGKGVKQPFGQLANMKLGRETKPRYPTNSFLNNVLLGKQQQTTSAIHVALPLHRFTILFEWNGIGLTCIVAMRLFFPRHLQCVGNEIGHV